MPEISRFYGIIIRMYSEADERHHMPHLHAQYQEYSAVFSIDPGFQIVGSLPNRQKRLVERWIRLYQKELAENWKLIDNGKAVRRIPPLR